LSTGRSLEAGVIGTVRLGIATEAPAQVAPSLLAAFGRERPEVDVTVFQSYAGALLSDLRDARLDAVIAPSIFGSAELRRLRLGSEPWAVLVGPGHRLAQPGPIEAHELHGVQVVVTGHRDGAGHDRAVAELLEGFGVTPVLRRGGPGPALYSAVVAGMAVAVTTGSAATNAEIVVRPIEPVRRLRFALLWRDETPAPALRELISTAQAHVAPARPAARPRLASVA
jgi:DNA-binding transcriptional LysR family regulator